MTEYKVEARGKVLIRGLDTRLSSGDSITVEDPVPSVMKELETLDRIGNIRLEELEEENFKTVEDEGPFEDEEVSEESEDNELMGKNKKFECTVCDRSHYADSGIGQDHLEEMLEEKSLEEIEILD